MFCPEGFVTLNEVWGEVLQKAHITIPPASDHPYPENTNPEATYVDMSERSAFCNWVIFRMLEIDQLRLYACLPTGTPVKLPKFVGEWLYFETEGMDQDALNKYDTGPWYDVYSRFTDKYSLRRFWLLLDFDMIDSKDWTFFYGDEYTETPLKMLHGLPLCVNEADLPCNIQEIGEWYFFAEKRTSAPPSSTSEFCLKAILQAYPNGKTDTWKIVEETVGYSRRHIIRTLTNEKKFEWWANPDRSTGQ